MSFANGYAIGIDIGGTKIAGALYGPDGREISQLVEATPVTYIELVTICDQFVRRFDQDVSTLVPDPHSSMRKASVGVGIPATVDRRTGLVPYTANIPCLPGQALPHDLEKIFSRAIVVANDADCAALAEATDGAGAHKAIVFGLVLGTGVGGGLVVNRHIVTGPNGLTGEIGHLPLPYRDEKDGPIETCVCGQKGCLDKSISGPALVRLYQKMTGEAAEPDVIAALAKAGQKKALDVLEQFYVTIAKALVIVLHAYDPDVIVVSGGLSALPSLYEAVPKYWGRYALCKNPVTQILPARHGARSGLRGAALVGLEKHAG